ncbi:MAG: 4Fe-4S binding protein [Bacteroidales bacterium]|nr:4Fe-4S binding protein [Bacteroidales bacterium]
MHTALYIAGAILALWMTGSLIRHFKNKNRAVRVTVGNCTGCGACLRRCNHRVLEMANDGQSRHIFVKYPDRCTGCGGCVPKCKFNALETVFVSDIG